MAMRRDGAFHEVAEHDGRKRVERGCHAVVGVYASAVEVVEGERVVVERVEGGGEVAVVAEGSHEVCRHALHENHHHVRPLPCCRRCFGVCGQWVYNRTFEHVAAINRSCYS